MVAIKCWTREKKKVKLTRMYIHFVVRLYKAKAIIIGWLILELLDHVFSALVIEENIKKKASQAEKKK